MSLWQLFFPHFGQDAGADDDGGGWGTSWGGWGTSLITAATTLSQVGHSLYFHVIFLCKMTYM